jgi:hypothetical protein
MATIQYNNKMSGFPDSLNKHQQASPDAFKEDPVSKDDEPLLRNYIDTMRLFGELRELGFTEQQSDIILELIKDNISYSIGNLEQKMLNANELENEMYLFEAAQSELRVEIKTSREADLRALQSEKSLLENLINEESDDLNKQLIVTRNDSQLSINDQISENTLLQKKIKRRIQDLNNRISTEINGDIKSEIEGLRWHTTSRGLMAVLVLVFAIMSGVSISKKRSKEDVPTEVILRNVEPEEHGEEEEEDNLEKISLEKIALEKK